MNEARGGTHVDAGLFTFSVGMLGRLGLLHWLGIRINHEVIGISHAGKKRLVDRLAGNGKQGSRFVIAIFDERFAVRCKPAFFSNSFHGLSLGSDFRPSGIQRGAGVDVKDAVRDVD